jgi:hypothetical protein
VEKLTSITGGWGVIAIGKMANKILPILATLVIEKKIFKIDGVNGNDTTPSPLLNWQKLHVQSCKAIS